MATLVVGLAYQALRERPGWLWTGSWLSVIAAGGAVLFDAEGWSTLGLGSPPPPFPGFQLAGALALVRGSAPLWVGVVALLAGLVRVAGDVAGLPGIGVFVGVALEPPVTLGAAALLARHARGERGGGGLG